MYFKIVVQINDFLWLLKPIIKYLFFKSIWKNSLLFSLKLTFYRYIEVAFGWTVQVIIEKNSSTCFQLFKSFQ